MFLYNIGIISFDGFKFSSTFRYCLASDLSGRIEAAIIRSTRTGG